MDTEKDLSSASRETLLEIISQLQATVGELQQRIAQLEAQVSSHKPPGMPGIKPSSTRLKERKATRQPRPKGFARPRTTPTHRVQHQLDKCPDCGTRLKGGWVQKRREVIEIPVIPAQVTEHIYLARRCPCCGKDHTPKVELEGVVAGKGRLGLNLVSLIVTLKEEARLPVRTIQWYLRTVHQLELSVGGIVGMCHLVAQRGKRLVEQIRDRVRASPVVHADETGWRQDGKNGYAWTFSTVEERYFVRGSRGKCVVEEVLGQEGRSILVTDFYAAYNTYPGLHQRCWAHLLRDIHELGVAWPGDEGLQKWSRAVKELFIRAKGISAELGRRRADEAQCCGAQLQMEEALLKLCQPLLVDEMAVGAKLCRRIERHIKELFVFVAHPEVPADNNAAERSLRHLVTSRKISGGTRSDKGSETKMILATIFGTWRARSLNPLLECRSLLSCPQQ